MATQALFFYFFAILAIAFSLVTILKKNPAVSAFCLVVVFICFAAIYALLGAHVIAALQIIVYAGAIMVLFIFVIMLLNADAPSFDMGRSPWFLRTGIFLLCGALFATFVVVFRHSPLSALVGPFNAETVQKMGGNTRLLSTLLFTDYLYPFELTSALILAGIVGSVAIAKRKNPRTRGEA